MTESRPSLTRAISETLFGTKRRAPDGAAAAPSAPAAKRAKQDPAAAAAAKAAKAAFDKQEEAYDALLAPQDRQWRPRGYKLNPPPTDRPVRIYADGVFDLFHLGHMKQLEQCKKTFPNVELIVGIPNDRETHKRKGLTVLSDKQRYETLRHCKWVDEVVEDAPWILSMDFLRAHKIDYCAHDDLPYVADGIDDIYKPMKEAGMFIATQRTEGISTSDLITKIIRDYDKYLMRNLARGATRQELNVSWLKKNELDMKKHLSDFAQTWKETNDKYHNITRDLYTLVRESMIKNNTLPMAKSPLERFAQKFNANGLTRQIQSKSMLGAVMDWVGFQSEPASEVDTEGETEADTRPVTPRKLASLRKPSRTPKKSPAIKAKTSKSSKKAKGV